MHKLLAVAIGSLLADVHPTMQMAVALCVAILAHAGVLYQRPLRMKRL